MHRDSVSEFGKLFIFGHEVGLTREHDGPDDRAARVRIGGSDAGTKRAVGLFGCYRRTLFAQNDFRLFDVAARFIKRFLALHYRNACFVTELLEGLIDCHGVMRRLRVPVRRGGGYLPRTPPRWGPGPGGWNGG